MMLRCIALTICIAAPAIADPALDPDVTQSTINETICVTGYTETIRPPFYVSQRIKRGMLIAKGETWDQATAYQLDHIVPLCLGGHPTDPSNLQLEPIKEAYRKDRVEVQAMRCVCAGRITLEQARHDLVTDWEAAYHRYAVMVCRSPR